MKILTVSQVVFAAKQQLESLFPELWVQGEISNLNLHSSGHAYFSLKDAHAQMSAVMFRDDVRRLRFTPENGLQVIFAGRLTVYPPQGRFQMIGTTMEPQGKGSLQLAFEQLKAKLEKEGLFEQARKKLIPALPQWIGVVTSSDGAALHDILSVLDRRFGSLRILVCPARVQGEGAAQDIAESIRRLNRDYPELEVLLVGRGGGSLEDLWAFNEELVARAIAESRIPMITCVGNETDYTIADFVSDLRAPTPSAAAELVIEAKEELRQRLTSLFSHLKNHMQHRLLETEQRLRHRLSSRMLLKPTAMIEEAWQDLDSLRERLEQGASLRIEGFESAFQRLAEKLQLLSPLGTLARGYAIAWRLPERTLLKQAAVLHPKDRIEVQLREGKVYAEVQRIEL